MVLVYKIFFSWEFCFVVFHRLTFIFNERLGFVGLGLDDCKSLPISLFLAIRSSFFLLFWWPREW